MSIDVQNLEKKFLGVSNSQESIQTLSLWILHHKNHNKKIIQTWLKFLEKEKTSRKLTLFYLANDVIQNAKKKNIKQYLDGFQEVLKKATILVKDERIVSKISRVFSIWIERNIYPAEFINNLKKILEDDIHRDYSLTKANSDFTLTDLEMKNKEAENVDKTTKMIIGGINVSKIDSLSNQVLGQLKDKKSGEQYFKEFTDIEKVLKNAVSALEKQIQVRKTFLECLEKCEIFYETQKSEVKIVTNAYKNFSIRVKTVKNKLSNSKNSLPSPLLSPNIDAPSPTNSEDDLILPGNNSPLPGLKNLLNVLNESSSKNNKISSLDKRLSNLMQNIPAINIQNIQKVEGTKEISSYKEENSANSFESKWHSGLNQKNIPQPMQQVYQYGSQISPIIPEHNFYACFPPPPPPPPIISTDKINSTYNYYNDNNNFATNNQGVNIFNGSSSSVQQIKSVISTRSEQEMTLNNLSTEQSIPYDPYADNLTTMENFEPADMDLGNSDDEDNMNRSQNSQRVLKVIETSSDTSYKTMSSTYHANPTQLNLQHNMPNLPHSFTHQPQSQINMHNFTNYHNGKQNKPLYSPAKTFHHDNRSPRWSNNHSITGSNNTSLSHVNLSSYGNGSNRTLNQQSHSHYNSNRSWKNSNSRSNSHNNHNKNRSSFNNNHHY